MAINPDKLQSSKEPSKETDEKDDYVQAVVIGITIIFIIGVLVVFRHKIRKFLNKPLKKINELDEKEKEKIK